MSHSVDSRRAPRARSSTSRRAFLAAIAGVAMVLPLGLALPARATPTPSSERYVVELRVIEGSRDGDGVVDAKLAALSRDLKSLPFKTFRLRDAQTSVVGEGERVSLEIPGAALQQKADKKGRKFLVVSAHGRHAGGKLRFSLGIEALKFETLVAVPEGGTIIVGGPRGDNGNAVLFAFTARTQK
jgi:hypothetical protein